MVKIEIIIFFSSASVDILRLLVDHGARINPMNSNGDTPFKLAVKKGIGKITKLWIGD